MKDSIVNIFPIPVAKYRMQREFTKKEYNTIDAESRNYRQDNGTIFNLTSLNTFVLEHPKLKQIKQFVLESVNNFYNEVYLPNNNSTLKITQSWINYNKLGHSHPTHCHTNSFISGILYINANVDHDVIVFSRPSVPFLNNFCINSKEATIYTTTNVALPVGTGDLILFPSSLTHSVPQVIMQETRISLSFNTFFSGKLGFDETQNSLSIETL